MRDNLCKTTGKVQFHTRMQAEEVISRPKKSRYRGEKYKRTKASKETKGKRSYRCEFCGMWHIALSVKPKNKRK